MTTLNTTSPRYNRGAIAFHWIIAVLIILNVIGALVSEDMPKEEAAAVMANHKAIGLTILFLSVLRIIWRLMHKAPPLAATLKAWEVALAKVTHALFYILIIAIPIAGWGLASAGGKGAPIGWFGLFNIPALPVPHDRATAGAFGETHEVLAFLLLGLLVLHVAAALKHQFIDHDETMARMSPFGKR